MDNLKTFMAKRCEHCPLCQYARKEPDKLLGKIMHWHGTWCPFWKAWEEEFGEKSKNGEKAGESKA